MIIMFCLKFPLIEKANISFRWFVNHDDVDVDDEVDENDNDADDAYFYMFFQLTLFVYSVCCSFPHLWATQVCLLCRVMAQRSSRSSCKKDIVVTSPWHVLISLTPTAWQQVWMALASILAGFWCVMLLMLFFKHACAVLVLCPASNCITKHHEMIHSKGIHTPRWLKFISIHGVYRCNRYYMVWTCVTCVCVYRTSPKVRRCKYARADACTRYRSRCIIRFS